MDIRFINILKLIEIEEKRAKKKEIKNKLEFKTFVLIIGLVATSIISALLSHAFEYEKLLLVSLILLMLTYLAFIITPFISIYQNRNKIKKSFTLPFNLAINQNVKKDFIIDQRYLKELIALDKKELELGLMEIKHERNFLEKRTLLITGPIDKLGILPGIISTLAATTKLADPNSWLMGISYGYIALIILSLFFYQIMMRYDRMIALTELAISENELLLNEE
ncbi:hypothetical protein [Pectobacterium carotovorum]|uniref:hypothetical protein n=1 Tax=Pectobacterium carotovorum TaxID=554 RepID=UPI001CF25814|nr:hypothetical protein [Pectobacterium carotovorum]MCA6972963.1 hypothetical protein [Pectobacterium carotovorum]